MNKQCFFDAVRLALWIFFLALLRTAAGELLSVGGVVPDLLFAFSLAFACTQKDLAKKIAAAFVCGIAADFLCGSAFTGACAIYAASALGMSLVKNIFIRQNIFLQSIGAFVLFFAVKCMCWGAMSLYESISMGLWLKRYILPVSFYNTLCFAVMLMILKIGEKRRKKRDEQL